MSSKDNGDEKPYHMQFGQAGSEDQDEPIPVPNETPKEATDQLDSDTTKRVDIGTIRTLPGITYSTYQALGKGLISSARITEDGEIVISLDLKEALPDLPKDYAKPVREYAVDPDSLAKVPAMNIVIMIVGSRGDVQPYIVLGKALQRHGHRVRLATHETFRKMVRDADMEFYPIGGDPAELMSYMVRNPGLLPGFESLVNGDIPKKRKMLSDILDGCWKACYEPDSERGVFAADAIISNPPAFAHIHCAEALGIPLHMSFTMPWCATTAFPHPLVVVNSSNAEPGLTNYLTYALADLIQWQGLGDIINRFRAKTLGLEPLSLRSGPSVIDRLRIPWTYCFSPTLIPQPKDWSNHIDVVGFYFLEGATGYTPEPALQAFLDKGDPPMYIGFGSVVVEDSKAMTETIFEAVKLAGIRAIVSAGWGGLGGTDVPENIFILPGQPGVPHDWLFTKVSAVCHHGGAGTTAIGLLLEKPTIIVPFFGDQPFWGKMVHKAGAGPEPIPHKKLTAENLSAAFKFCETPTAKSAAQEMGKRIKSEDGPKAGVDSFYAHLPLLNMRCDLDPSRIAVWWSTEHCLKLSAFAAGVLVDARLIKLSDLEPHRSREYDTRKKTTDPITGGLGAIFWTVTNYYSGIAQIFFNPVKGVVNTTTAIPRGIANIVGSVQEGFYNMPKLYGSEVRPVGPITDFKSGMREGGKGLFYGYYDAITGLVTEPVKGAQKEGILGAIKGSARSFVNASMRPAAGALGLVTHPARGLWNSMQSTWARQQASQLRETRQQEGQQARKIPAKPGQRGQEEVKQAFNDAKKTTNQRREALKQEGISFLRGGGGLNLEQHGEHSTATSSRSGERSVELPDERDSKKGYEGTSSATKPEKGSAPVEQDEESFQRDMAIATRLSLLEQ